MEAPANRLVKILLLVLLKSLHSPKSRLLTFESVNNYYALGVEPSDPDKKMNQEHFLIYKKGRNVDYHLCNSR